MIVFSIFKERINYEPKGGGLGIEEGDEERWKGRRNKTEKNIKGN
jgi:hypothetical protein